MNPTVLLIDDEPHVTSVLKHRLETMQFNVLTAGDGKSGLALARDSRPAVICSDIQMPGLSGIELAKMLRDDQSTASIPLFLLSARGYIVAQRDLDLTNVIQQFDKPFSPRKVAAAIAAAVIAGGGAAGRSEAA